MVNPADCVLCFLELHIVTGGRIEPNATNSEAPSYVSLNETVSRSSWQEPTNHPLNYQSQARERLSLNYR